MYLIDTHVIIWTLYNPEELPQKVKDILDNEQCFFSIASLWEMAIKIGLKKININQSIREIADSLFKSGIEMRSITPEDCDIVKEFPAIHKDPFDRIIIAQALESNLTIVTKDGLIPQYDVNTVWE